MGKKKKSNNPFKDLQGAAGGLAGLGITTAVGAGVASKAPAGSPSVSAGFNTIASFTPIVATSVGGRSVLKQTKKLKKKVKNDGFY